MADTTILFPEPCHEDWEAMHPEGHPEGHPDGHQAGRARLCDACDKTVHDLSHYTPEEADTLIFGGAIPACVRATILPDGRVVTLPGRAGKVLMAAIATPALLFATANAAIGSNSGPAPMLVPGTGAIAGSVSAAGTPIRVTVEAGKLRKSARVAIDGTYRFDRLPPGEYKLVFSSEMSPRWTIARVAVRADHVTVRNTYDPALPVMATMGVPPPVIMPPPPVQPVMVTGGMPVPVPMPVSVPASDPTQPGPPPPPAGG
jgi:hypothetical protein